MYYNVHLSWEAHCSFGGMISPASHFFPFFFRRRSLLDTGKTALIGRFTDINIPAILSDALDHVMLFRIAMPTKIGSVPRSTPQLAYEPGLRFPS